MIPLLDLRSQYLDLMEDLNDAVLTTMANASFIGGEAVTRFEAELAAYLNVKHVITCNSGTDALVLALKAKGIGFGDEVITTPYTFFATAEAIVTVGAEPVFVDIDPETYNLDTRQVQDAITEYTRAIIPVHLFGRTCPMPHLRYIADTHDLFLLEDACQAIGARGVGLGDAAAYSFFPSKNLGCAGDGGALTTDDDDLAALARSLAHHGIGDYKYLHHRFGMNSRLDAMQAAILSVKLPHLDRWNGLRQAAAAIYDDLLRDTPLTLPQGGYDGSHVYHLYIVRHDHAAELTAALRGSGIGTGIYYPRPLHRQKAFLGYWPEIPCLPVSENTASTTFALPCYPGITVEQQQEVVDVLKGEFR